MQNDYQVRANSPYRHLSEVMRETLISFATHAPTDAQLVFKVHPWTTASSDGRLCCQNWLTRPAWPTGCD